MDGWNVPGPPLNPEGREVSQNFLVLLMVPVVMLLLLGALLTSCCTWVVAILTKLW